MTTLLNYASSPITTITSRGLGVSTAIATLPNIGFERQVWRIHLATTFVKTDLITPTDWNDYAETVNCVIRVGSNSDLSAMVDATSLGDWNTAEYTYPLVIPAKTDLYVLWFGLLPSALSKGIANLTVVSS